MGCLASLRREEGGGKQPISSLLLSLSADARSSDDVITFEDPRVRKVYAR